MSYFSCLTSDFLLNISENNNREWFSNNKINYQNNIETPSKFFAEDMSLALEKITKERMSAKIFRFYRDVRFSKDKTPYNTHIRLAFYPSSKEYSKLCDAPTAFYFSLKANKLMLGSGNMKFNPNQLQNYRHRIKNQQTRNDLDLLISKYNAKGYEINEPQLKRSPQYFNENEQLSSLTKFKGLAAFKSISINQESIGDMFYVTKDLCTEILPLYKWFLDLNEQLNI
jgi:uncharacterized protein (TIGR02453 family)